jgi:hypothetical protein
MAADRFEDALLGLVPCGAFAYSWHISFSLQCAISGLLRQLMGAEKQTMENGIRPPRGHVGLSGAELDLHRLDGSDLRHGRLAQPATTLGVLAAHQVTGAGPAVFDLALGGHFDSLGEPFMGLLLRHLP